MRARPVRPLALLALAGAFGCALEKVPASPPAPTFLTARHHRLGADCAAAPDATAVRCGARVAAELHCFAPEGRTCRALALRYADGEVAWLYRPPTFDPAHPAGFVAPAEKDVLRAFGPSVSWDGRLVWFGARTLTDRGAVREFDVQTGELRTVEKNSEWKVPAAEPQHRAIPIGAAAAPWPAPAPPPPPPPPPGR